MDDHEVVRRGMVELLDLSPDLEVVGQAGSLADAKWRLELIEIDCVVVDQKLGDGLGTELCAWLHERSPEICSMVLTAFDDQSTVRLAQRAGARGVLSKELRGAEIVAALSAAVRDRRHYFPPSHHPQPDEVLGRLTTRERIIATGVASGLSNAEIGQRIGISEKTVRNHLTSVFQKLEITRRTQLAVLLAPGSDD